MHRLAGPLPCASLQQCPRRHAGSSGRSNGQPFLARRPRSRQLPLASEAQGPIAADASSDPGVTPPPPVTPETASSVAAPAAAAIAVAASTSSAGSSTDSGSPSSSLSSDSAKPPLAVLTAAEPIDRLRYQAVLLFDHFDADRDGRLIGEEVEAFFSYSARKVLWSPGLAEVLKQVQDSFYASRTPGAVCSRDEFVRLLRAQVHAVSSSPAYQGSALRADIMARLQAQNGLTAAEVAGAKWVHGLLDFDNDGFVALIDLEAAQGIEAYMVEDKLLDADANGDGLLTFEEFVSSYAKPRPVAKNMLIMVANTLAIWALLQSPLDIMIKTIGVVVLLLRPQIISKPTTLIYDGFKALYDNFRVNTELARQQQDERWKTA